MDSVTYFSKCMDMVNKSLEPRPPKPRCPEMSTIGAGDESMDVCCIRGKQCLLISGAECETYQEFLEKKEEW